MKGGHPYDGCYLIFRGHPQSGQGEETVVAIGAGAQMFPNKGGPYGEEQGSARNVARQAAHEVREAVESTADVVKEGIANARNSARKARIELERTHERKEEREGWNEAWKEEIDGRVLRSRWNNSNTSIYGSLGEGFLSVGHPNSHCSDT